MRKKKLLITGALGHIGSSLIRNLGDSVVHEVTLLDNLESHRYPSLFNLPIKFKFKFIKDDITTADFKKYLTGIDVVIHLAASPYENGNHKNPKEIKQANSLGLKRVADACLAKNVELFFPSTTSVYGSRASVVDETCPDLLPQSPHAEEKLTCERYLQKLGKEGLKYTICRFGTIYGYSIGMRFDTAVNKFIFQATSGESLTVWKTAWKQNRPYLYLDDATRAINFIVKKNLFDGQVYNVVSQSFAVADVVAIIRKFIPKLKVSYINSPIMNNLSYEVNDKKIQSLGFKPNGKLEIGVEETISQLKGII